MIDRSPDRVVALCRAFMESRVLLTAAELDLFGVIGEGEKSVDEIAASGGWDLRGVRILLDDLVVLGFLDKHRRGYSCPPEILDLMTREGKRSILAFAHHHAELWKRWSELTQRVVGNGKVVSVDPLQAFIDTMHCVAQPLSPGIAAAIRPTKGSRVLDLGGGSGAYTQALLERDRSLRMTLFDRPEVLPHAKKHLACAECLEQVILTGGDFMVDPLPGPQDMVLLSAVVHSLSLEQCLVLFGKLWDILVPGGRIVIRDHIMSEDHTRPRAGALFAVNMLVATPEGGTHSQVELTTALQQAGFVEVDLVQYGERMDGMLFASKPNE